MKSFTFRVTFRFAALVTATTAAVLAVGGLLLALEAERGLELLHDVEVRELAELIGTDGTLTAEKVSERIKHDADSDAALFVMQIADARGEVLFRSDNLGDTILPAAAAGKHWTTAVPFLGRVHLSYYEVGPWRIHIGSPLEPSARVLREYARIGGVLLAAVALVSVGLGYAFSRATLRPLRAIAHTATRIGVDNFAERVPVPSGNDELTSLALLLNHTFDRLQTSFEQMQRFAADASHELKTPLALIRLNLEKLRARLQSDAEAGGAVGDVLEELTRMHQVIDRLLFLARSESGAVVPTLKSVDMAALVQAFAEDATALAEDGGVRFAVGENAAGEIRADPDLIRQLLLNLVANAVRVSPPGSVVRLDSQAANGGWRLVVTDEGPGVAPADIPRIFDRFVRIGQEASRAPADRPGHGLGLAICRSIAQLHHGAIRAENRTDRSGLRMTVTLVG